MTPSTAAHDPLSSTPATGLRARGQFLTVAALRAQGLGWDELGERMGVSPVELSRCHDQERAEAEVDLRPLAGGEMGTMPVRATVGGWVDVLLPSLAGAGYLWQAQVEAGLGSGSVSVPVRQLLDGRLVPSPTDAPVGDTPGQAEHWSFQAKAPGTTTLVFIQDRPWEKGAPPIATRRLQVQVSG